MTPDDAEDRKRRVASRSSPDAPDARDAPDQESGRGDVATGDRAATERIEHPDREPPDPPEDHVPDPDEDLAAAERAVIERLRWLPLHPDDFH